MLTNCKNCGAPIHYGVCEYCGTDYREPNHIYFNFTPPKPYKRTNWAETQIVPDWAQSNSTNPYMINDKVRFEGRVYVSLINNNVWSPSTSQAWDYYYENYYSKPTPIKTVRTN